MDIVADVCIVFIATFTSSIIAIFILQNEYSRKYKNQVAKYEKLVQEHTDLLEAHQTRLHEISIYIETIGSIEIALAKNKWNKANA